MPETPAQKNGHKLTADRVFRDYAPRVFALARRMLGNEADAEDVTQDVLLQVVRKLDTFRGESSLETWLHRATAIAVPAFRRKRAAIPERQPGSSPGSEATESPADGRRRPAGGPEEQAQGR